MLFNLNWLYKYKKNISNRILGHPWQTTTLKDDRTNHAGKQILLFTKGSLDENSALFMHKNGGKDGPKISKDLNSLA